ncbi:MAG: DUF4837 family protein [Candidatus Marinimicrobia bacterium]|nr:DUF4837 family protein [Candidatus Neomarinimicrobiota bacterium]
MNKSYLHIGLMLCLIIAGCERQRNSIGGVDEIHIFAADEVRTAIGQAVDTTFSYGMRMPEFQPYFFKKWKPLDKFQHFLNYKNIILIADLNRNDLASEIARGILPKENFLAAESDSIHMFAIPDNWAKGQMFVLIAGRDMQLVERSILEQKGWLYGKFEEKFEEGQSNYMYNRLEQFKLTEYFWQKYRWTMRIPRDYMIIKEMPEKNFVWLGRGLPYRWISVNWERGIQTEWMTNTGLYEKRNQIGKLYDGVMTDKRFLGYQFIKFGEYDALKMYGLWYHEVETKGGPFETIAFYDWHTDRTFVIDMLMYAPGEKLSVMFRGLEILAKTFTTEYKGYSKKSRN